MNPNINSPTGPLPTSTQISEHMPPEPKCHEFPSHRGAPAQMSSTLETLMKTHPHSTSSIHGPAPSTTTASCPPSHSELRRQGKGPAQRHPGPAHKRNRTDTTEHRPHNSAQYNYRHCYQSI
ncbi:hypothetical protein ILYODFUR_003004 [Ilyodon furcidens]|uniref:Uncharacterized protein n=1 Tax=Ilyodon furcidens TaxID=33524 RepID=A0ABV0T8H8_9TELE